MTDRDPAGPRRTPKTPAPADPVPGPTPPASTGLRDRWWWSPTLMIVVGFVVIGYQLGPLRSGEPVWGNWAVAVLGLGVAIHGAVQLRRAHRAR